MQVTITGIRYRFPSSLPKEVRTEMAEELVRNIPPGTELVLKAEPDNIKDTKAVAVYMNWVQKIGYVSNEELAYVHPLLNSAGEADALVTANDGHITMFAEIKNAPHIDSIPLPTERTLPAPPFDPSVFLPFTDDARALDIVAGRLTDCCVCDENAGKLFCFLDHIKPRVRKSISTEDTVILSNTQKKIMEMQSSLNLTDTLAERLDELHLFFKNAVGDLKDNDIIKSIFQQHYDQLKVDATTDFNEKYDRFYLNGNIDTAPAETIKSEYDRLNKWLLNIPNGVFRGNNEDLAPQLVYLHLTRRELYDIISVMITRERLAERMNCIIAEEERKQHEEETIIEKLAHDCFYGDKKEARAFLLYIDKTTKPVEITNRVNELVKQNIISEKSCHRTMWTILHENNLYKPSENNWNSQIKAQNPK